MFTNATALVYYDLTPFEGFAFNIAIKDIGTITAVSPTDIAIKSASIISKFHHLALPVGSLDAIHDNLLSFLLQGVLN